MVQTYSCKIRSSKIALGIQLCNHLESKEYFKFFIVGLFENPRKIKLRKGKFYPVEPFLSVAVQKYWLNFGVKIRGQPIVIKYLFVSGVSRKTHSASFQALLTHATPKFNSRPILVPFIKFGDLQRKDYSFDKALRLVTGNLVKGRKRKYRISVALFLDTFVFSLYV